MMVVFIKKCSPCQQMDCQPSDSPPYSSNIRSPLQKFLPKTKNTTSPIPKTTCTKISLAVQQLWLGCSRAALRQKSATASTCNHPSNPALAIQVSGCPLGCRPKKLSFLICFILDQSYVFMFRATRPNIKFKDQLTKICHPFSVLHCNYNGEIGQKFDFVITFDWRVLLT